MVHGLKKCLPQKPQKQHLLRKSKPKKRQLKQRLKSLPRRHLPKKLRPRKQRPKRLTLQNKPGLKGTEISGCSTVCTP